MSLNFLNPHLLWLLALVAVPLLLHLFARSKPPVYEFSSVEFLRRIVKKTMRWKKPQDWILLLLRTLAVLALVGAFLRPLLFPQEKLSGLFQKKNLVAIVDASASMALVEGAQTRFATACAETGDLLSGLSGNDQANVIWLKAEPEAIFPDELASNIGYLKEQLRRAGVTSERGSIEKAFALAAELLEGTEGKKEICVVSDFQRSAWEDFSPSLPEDTDLIHVKIGKRETGNQAVTRLTSEPANPVVGEEIALHATIFNYSEEEVETTLFSEAGESRSSRNLSLPPGESITATFRHVANEPGLLPLKVSLSEDAFPGDDQRVSATTVRPYFRLAMTGNGDPDTVTIWTRAGQAIPWAVPEWIQPSDLNESSLQSVDVVFQAGSEPLPEGSSDVLHVWQPAGNTRFSLTPPEGKLTEITASLENRSDGFYSIKMSRAEASVFDLFREGDHGSLEGLSGASRIRLAPVPPGKVLLEFEDGAPALLEWAPRRYLWLMPLNDQSGNFAGRVEFLPFFGELLLADRLTGSGFNQLDFEPGDPILWEPGETAGRESVQLLGPEGEPHPFTAGPDGKWIAEPFDRPGIYPWELRGETAGYSIVNFPAAESNLKTLTLDETQASASVAVEGGNEVIQLRDGIQIWPWLLTIAVCLFLLEGGVTLFAARTP